jgi:hypothetical protein
MLMLQHDWLCAAERHHAIELVAVNDNRASVRLPVTPSPGYRHLASARRFVDPLNVVSPHALG